MSELTERHIVYRFVGRAGEFVVGIPARDLTGEDLVEIEEREGISQEMVEATGLYEAVELAEVEPFCGWELEGGGRCRRRVGEWGERCYQHKDEED